MNKCIRKQKKENVYRNELDKIFNLQWRIDGKLLAFQIWITHRESDLTMKMWNCCICVYRHDFPRFFLENSKRKSRKNDQEAQMNEESSIVRNNWRRINKFQNRCIKNEYTIILNFSVHFFVVLREYLFLLIIPHFWFYLIVLFEITNNRESMKRYDSHFYLVYYPFVKLDSFSIHLMKGRVRDSQ